MSLASTALQDDVTLALEDDDTIALALEDDVTATTAAISPAVHLRYLREAIKH